MEVQNLHKANDLRMKLDSLNSLLRACEEVESDHKFKIQRIHHAMKDAYFLDLSGEVSIFAQLIKLSAKKMADDIEREVAEL